MRQEAFPPAEEKRRLPYPSSVKKPRETCGRVLSVCSYCDRFRGDDGGWYPLGLLGAGNSHWRFSHGICPACAEALYPELYEAVTAKRAVV